MNYLQLVNAFYNKQKNKSLSSKSINLWHALAYTQNRLFHNLHSDLQNQKFSIPTSLLLELTSLSRPSIGLACKELVDHKLLQIYSDKNTRQTYQILKIEND